MQWCFHSGHECYTCENIDDPRDCYNLTETSNDQSCFTEVNIVGQAKTYTLGITTNKNCGAIPANNITKVKRDVDKKCFECCSKDKCNNQLCQHRKPSKCIDDVRIDCAHISMMFNICRNVHQAKKICPNFCGLCSLVDGNWAYWSEWSPCDVTCDVGVHTRRRTCTNPSPANRGLQCEGNETETKPCNNMLCPVNGGWSDWSDWEGCSVTCGIGLRKRNRTCSNPYPKRTGVHCFGDSTEVEICTKKTCSDVNPTVAFKADAVSDFTLHDKKILVFTHNILNFGDTYNNKTGLFVAPVQGLYMFTAQICMTPKSHSYYGISVDERVLTKALLGDKYYTKCYTLDALSDVNLAGKVAVKCLSSCDSSESLYRDSNMISSFSGFLIKANID